MACHVFDEFVLKRKCQILVELNWIGLESWCHGQRVTGFLVSLRLTMRCQCILIQTEKFPALHSHAFKFVWSRVLTRNEKDYRVVSTSFCKFSNFSSRISSRKYDSCIICFKRKMSLSKLHDDGYDVFSTPSGVINLSAAMMQPCVSLREFSVTSTPNCTISPEDISYGSDALIRWLFINVPLLLPVSYRGGEERCKHQNKWKKMH